MLWFLNDVVLKIISADYSPKWDTSRCGARGWNHLRSHCLKIYRQIILDSLISCFFFCWKRKVFPDFLLCAGPSWASKSVGPGAMPLLKTATVHSGGEMEMLPLQRGCIWSTCMPLTQTLGLRLRRFLQHTYLFPAYFSSSDGTLSCPTALSLFCLLDVILFWSCIGEVEIIVPGEICFQRLSIVQKCF